VITSGFDAQRVDSTSNDQPGSALPTETLQEIEDRGQGSIPWVWKMALGERPGNKAVFFFHVVCCEDCFYFLCMITAVALILFTIGMFPDIEVSLFFCVIAPIIYVTVLAAGFMLAYPSARYYDRRLIEQIVNGAVNVVPKVDDAEIPENA
jgi:hypothetical protein